LIRLQELSFMRKLVFDLREASDGNHFGKDEYNLFVDRLPTYLGDVVLRELLKFKQYTANRVGLARHMGRAGVKRFLNDIVDGVSKVDQTASIFLMPDNDALADMSRELAALAPAPVAKKKRRGRSSKNA